ncbi:hypothetical protein GCM10010234_41080 [Streptomyces hawaiiensis]
MFQGGTEGGGIGGTEGGGVHLDVGTVTEQHMRQAVGAQVLLCLLVSSPGRRVLVPVLTKLA